MSLFESLSPGSGGWVEIPLAGSAPIEAYVLRGGEAGPRTVVTAGIHGDEFEGPAALMDLVADLRLDDFRGDLVLIPVANPPAFAAASRTSPEDGKNLARAFPGDPTGSPTERLAATLFGAVGEADHLVDLHSGGVACEFWPVAGFYGPAGPANPSFLAASRMGLSGLWRLPPTPGVLSYEMSLRGSVVVGCEYGGGGRLDPLGRQSYRAGVLEVLGQWGHFPGQAEGPRGLSPSFEGDWTLSEADGLFASPLRPGDRVDRGAELARIIGPRGELRQSIEANWSGTILALRSLASIRKGDWAVMIGVESRPAHG